MYEKIISIFYDANGLPYKDKERMVHFPIVGSAFLGASKTTKIRFYFDRLGNENVTWVSVAKLPNGKQGSKVLSVSTDSEINEHYCELALSNWYTQAKGDVYVALQGYQGGVNYTYDSESQLYTISGTPTIQTTGSIKLAVNYAPIGDSPDYNDEFTTYQQILAALGDKLDIDDGIVVVSNVTQVTASDYDNGQLFYDLATKSIYRKVDGSIVLFFTAYSKDETYNKTEVYSKDETYSKAEVNTELNKKADKVGPLPYFTNVSPDTILIDFVNEHSLKDKPFIIQTIGVAVHYTTLLCLVNTSALGDQQFGFICLENDSFYTGLGIGLLENKTIMQLLVNYKVNYEETKNKVTSLSSGSTNTQYPSAKCVYDNLQLKADKSDTYTKSEIDTKLTSMLVYKGTLTVTELNALSPSLTTTQTGWFYNVSDSGVLNAGNVEVLAGDNVAWTGTTWDKVTMDLSAYDDKFIAAGFFEVQNYNETSGEITFVYASDLYSMSYSSDTGILTIQAN